MARPLQDRSRHAEPPATAAVSGSPAFPLGGTVALPPTLCRRSPPPWTPRLNGGGMAPGGRSRSLDNGTLHLGTLPGTTYQSPREEDVDREGAAAAAVEPEHGAAEPNGHLPRHLPTLEQEIGARLRQMGDQFQQDYEQRERRPPGALWGHFYHLVFHLLGVLYNLPVRG